MARREHEVLFKISATMGSGFTGAFASAKTAVSGLQATAKSVNATLENIEGYKQTEKALAGNKEKIALLTTEHNRLNNSIKSNADEISSLNAKREELYSKKDSEGTTPELEKAIQKNEAAIAKAEEQSSKLNSALKKNETQTERTNTKIGEQEEKLKSLKTQLDSAGVSTDNLAEDTARLSSQYDKLKASQDRINNINKAIAQNNSNISQTKAELGRTVATAAVIGGAMYKGAIEPSMKFASQMSTVGAISQASARDMQVLTNKAKEMGRTTAFSASESGKAMEYMAMAGWKSSQMLAGIDGVINLAAASGEDLATVSDIVTDDLTAFGMQASETGHFADVLAAAATNSNTNVSMMGETFKYVGPLAGTMGYSIEDMAIAVGLMANSSIKGSQAGTALKNTIANMAAPTDTMAAAMKELGINLTDSSGNVKTFKQVMDELRASYSGLGKADQVAKASEVFGKYGMSGMLAVINATEADYKSLTTAIDNAEGAAERMAQTRLDNLEGDLTLAKSAAEGLQIALGDALTPALREVVQGITPVIEKLAAWVEKNPEAVQQIAGLITKFIAFKGATLSAKLAFQEMNGAYLTGKKAIEIYRGATVAATIANGQTAASATGLSTAIGLLATPLGLFVGGTALAIGSAYGIKKAFEYAEEQTTKFSDSFVKAFDEFQKVSNHANSTQSLIDEYRNLDEALRNYTEGSEQYAAAKQRMQEIEKILIEQNPEFLNTYDAENGKIKENLGYIEQKIAKEKELAKIKLEASAEDAKGKLPNAIGKQKDYSKEYDDYKKEYDKTIKARNDLAILDRSYQVTAERYKQGQITLDEYNAQKDTFVEKAKDIKYDFGLVGPMDTAEDITGMYSQANNQVENIIADMEITNQKYIETTARIQSYCDTQKQLIEMDLGMSLQDAANSLNNMNNELYNLKQSGQGGSDKAKQLQQSIAELQPKAETAAQKFYELEQSVKNVPDVKVVDTAESVSNCSLLKNIIDNIKSKTVDVKVRTSISGPTTYTGGALSQFSGLTGFASGGFIMKPTVAKFAEDYPEAAIPLNPNSDRSKYLWLKTGEYLGMDTTTGSSGIGTFTNSNYTGGKTEITITPVYHIYNNGNQDISEQLATHDRLLMSQIDERIEREKRLNYA